MIIVYCTKNHTTNPALLGHMRMENPLGARRSYAK